MVDEAGVKARGEDVVMEVVAGVEGGGAYQGGNQGRGGGANQTAQRKLQEVSP